MGHGGLCAPGRAKHHAGHVAPHCVSGLRVPAPCPGSQRAKQTLKKPQRWPGCLPRLALAFIPSRPRGTWLRSKWFGTVLQGTGRFQGIGDREPISELVKLRSEQGMQGPPCASSFSPSPRAGKQPFIFQMCLSPGDITGERVPREGALSLSASPTIPGWEKNGGKICRVP